MATTTERKSLLGFSPSTDAPPCSSGKCLAFWDSRERQMLSATEPTGSARQRHTPPTRSPRLGRRRRRACQTLPAARPDKSPPAVGGRTRRASRLLRPLLAALDLSALIGGALGAHTPPSGPEDAHVLLLNRHSETYARLWKHARGHARRKNVCCLLRVSLAPLHPSSLINSTFARACKSVILII